MNVRNIPLVDSHVHLWSEDQLSYPWLASVPSLNKTFALAELTKATQSMSIESFIFVQAECDPSQSLAEVEWVTKLSQEETRIRGIVAQAPLEQGEEVRQHLALLQQNVLVKGIRRLLQSEADDFCLQKKFIEGVQMLAEYNFSFDICIKSTQLPAVIKLVEQCPKVHFILDHMGKPNIAEKQMQPWQDHITTLASFPNVSCKISGLITEANHQTWRADDLKPYVLHAIKTFGFDRVIFGSDWPVATLAGTYTQWVSALNDITHSFSAADRIKLFYENSYQCYRLTKPAKTILHEMDVAVVPAYKKSIFSVNQEVPHKHVPDDQAPKERKTSGMP